MDEQVEISSDSGFSSDEEQNLISHFCKLCQKKLSGPRTALLAHMGTNHVHENLFDIGKELSMKELHLLVKIRYRTINRLLSI